MAGDILGKSGRDMLAALVAGTRDPQVLAELARGKLRGELPALRQALRGRFGAHHGLLVGQILAKLDVPGRGHRAAVGRDRPGARPVRAPRDLLCTIPGVDKRTPGR